MRKRIEELAEGKIPYEQPQVVFSKEKLEMEVIEGQTVTDSFRIKSKNGILMRGIVYSMHARMECLTCQFETMDTVIEVRFHADGMTEGGIATGDIYIVCNGGEYQLTYAVTVTRLYAEASTGKIKNLKDFTQLAKKEWKEAYHIFHSPAFKNILSPKEYRVALMYEGFANPAVTEQAMEEFLVGAGKKKRVLFSLEKHSGEYLGITETIKEKIRLHRDGWGYLEIRVSASAEFLVPEKPFLTGGDFMGDDLSFTFHIDTEKMHGGNNFACLVFENDIQREEFRIWVSPDSLEVKKERKYKKLQQAQTTLTQRYMDFRMKRLVTGEWAKQTVSLLTVIGELKPEDTWTLLFRAYALLRNRQRQDAQWLMSEFRQKFKDKNKPEWAFYDYLLLQGEKEQVVIDRLLAEMEDIVKRYGEHPVMFFLMLRLNGILRTQPQMKLRALEERVQAGEYMPLWYLEGFQVYKEQPYLLTRLTKYEILLMNWASRQGILTRDLADQVMRLANNMRQFHPIVCRILFRSYESFPDEDMLAGVCAYLIKGHRYQPAHHHWYAKGVEENLKITGLYEAFLLTMDLHGAGPLPKVIQMYFQYNNQLASQYKAALYVSIIGHKEEQPVIYGKYTETMKQFAIDEILKGHMDDNLAVIYEEMLDKGILTRELAAPLAEILYTHKFHCTSRAAAFVVVRQKHMKKEQRVPILSQAAYFQLFSNEYSILLENNRGQRFVSPEECQLEKLMKPSHYIRRCLKFAPEKIQYLMHHMDGRTDLKLPRQQDVEYLRILMDTPWISTKFKSQIGPGLLRYCMISREEEHLESYLSQIDFAGFDRENRNELIELMVDHGWNEKAYELVSIYGHEGIARDRLAHLASYMIQTRDIGEEVFLLEVCLEVLLEGKQNTEVTGYLAKYYEGPSKHMMLVYKAARSGGIEDLAELEERLLVQTLYSTEYVEGIYEVYQGYRQHNGREFVLQAYRCYYMHEYVVNGMVLPDGLFLETCQLQQEGRLSEMVCRLGLLKYFSECGQLDHYQMKEADELLGEFMSRNMVFAFYKNLPERLCGRYQLHNRVLVEYHARPDSRLKIHYRMSGDQDAFETANMPNIYDGIFTFEFLLFMDDEVEYYITRELESGVHSLCESRYVCGIEYRDVNHGGRYAYINHMLYLREQGNYKELMNMMQDYQKLDLLTDKLFKII